MPPWHLPTPPPRSMRWLAALVAAVAALGLVAGLTTTARCRRRRRPADPPGRHHRPGAVDAAVPLHRRRRRRERRPRRRERRGGRERRPAWRCAQNQTIAVVLVFDTSAAMDSSGALVAAKEAAGSWIAEPLGGRAGRPARRRLRRRTPRPTRSRASPATPLASSPPSSDVAPPADAGENDQSAMWGAIAARRERPAPRPTATRPNIVMMTGAGDDDRRLDASAANGAVASVRRQRLRRRAHSARG